MNKEERGKLLVEQEDINHAIAEMEKQLREYGSRLNALANSIMNNPVVARFANVPIDILGDQPKLPVSSNVLDWNKIPDKESVVRLTLELQRKKADLQAIQKALKDQVTMK